MIPEYGKINTVGHRDLRQLFDGPVIVQEKIDGSQFSAMVDLGGVLHCRSKGAEIDPNGDKHGQFSLSIAHIKAVRNKMLLGAIYRFEAMSRPKHNVLAYERVPAGNLVLYDVHQSGGYYSLDDLRFVGDELGVECVQEVGRGELTESALPTLLQAKPQLGGAMIEGVVIKNYALGLKGKFVAPRFQEIMHNRPAKLPKESPVADIGRKYCSEARWEKAISHLRDEGKIGPECENKDIGLVIREVQRDILEECGEEIRQELFSAYAKELRGAWIQGLPDWYVRRC